MNARQTIRINRNDVFNKAAQAWQPKVDTVISVVCELLTQDAFTDAIKARNPVIRKAAEKHCFDLFVERMENEARHSYRPVGMNMNEFALGQAVWFHNQNADQEIKIVQIGFACVVTHTRKNGWKRIVKPSNLRETLMMFAGIEQ